MGRDQTVGTIQPVVVVVCGYCLGVLSVGIVCGYCLWVLSVGGAGAEVEYVIMVNALVKALIYMLSG